MALRRLLSIARPRAAAAAPSPRRCWSVLAPSIQPLPRAAMGPHKASLATLTLDELSRFGGTEVFEPPKKPHAASEAASTVGFHIPLQALQALQHSECAVRIDGKDYVLKLEAAGPQEDMVAAKKAELAELQARIAPLETARRPIHAAALHYANRCTWGLTGGLFAQAAIVFKLTFFSRFGWDVMEPVAYFLTFGVGVASLLFFQFLGVEFTYPALRRALVGRYMRKATMKASFDETQYNVLAAAILKKHKELAALPGTDVFFKDAWAGIKQLMATTDTTTCMRAADYVHCVNRQGQMLHYNFFTGAISVDSAEATGPALPRLPVVSCAASGPSTMRARPATA